MTVDSINQTIRFAGTIYPHRYNTRKDRANGHHFLVWSGGGNAKKALINTDVPDADILDHLIRLGAVPGDNLSEQTWTERTNPHSPEPDLHVKGTPIQIEIEWDHHRLSPADIFRNATPSDFDIRVGGHAQLIPVWKSGCITCLFSCPGGRTSNSVYTIRDQANNRKEFFADESKLPQDGTAITIKLTLIEADESP